MSRKHFLPLAVSAALLGFAAAPALAQQSQAPESGSGNSLIPEKVDRLPDNSLPAGDENSLERGQSPGMDSPDANAPSDEVEELCNGAVAPDDKQRCDAGVNPPNAADGPNGSNPETNGTGANGGPRL